MDVSPLKSSVILLTGATGFVGKVVLEELLRRSQELKIEKIRVLIRPGKKGQGAESRLVSEIQASPCFSHLPKDCFSIVSAVEGELSQVDCGLSPGDQNELARSVTHLIHCAASVEFDLPIEQAANANITGSLNMLEFAKRCASLIRMVSVSTAYVTPHPKEPRPVEEKLVELPWPARETYERIRAGQADAAALLKQTGHPNTYTFTKCLAEKLLVENRGSVPLSIVRPSIVSACWKFPFAGWIDSKAAFAGFVALIGAGYLRAVIANDPTLLDVVPCDEVAKRIIDCAFYPPLEAKEKVVIRHAVAGRTNSCSIRTCIDVIEDYFRQYRVGKRPDLNYNGSNTTTFRLKNFLYHKVPLTLSAQLSGLMGKKKQKQKILRLLSRLDYLNTGFPYFTFNTFDFASTQPLAEADFVKAQYIRTVCRGVYRHLMGRNDTEILFAGRLDRNKGSDLYWALNRPRGNVWVRASACLVRKALRRFTESITLDQASFETAKAAIPPGTLPVVIPTHRSYLDFVLCSYLFFALPELGIPIPNIAAAEEFSRIPILGWLFTKTQAFYVRRGLGKADPRMTEKIQELVRGGKTLEFFIEGTRSRTRQMLPPRRGMLRCLQSTGQACTILPVTLTYDRIPEERSFLKEVKAYEKKPMTLRGLVDWMTRMFRREIHLGRIHLSCGRPLVLDHSSDLPSFAQDVMGELQRGHAVTTHHLRCFLEKHSELKIDLDWLSEAVTSRGGRVLASPLAADKKLDPVMELCMRHQWIHLFYSEALAAFPDNWAIEHHIRQNGFAPRAKRGGDPSDPRVPSLIKVLFEPVCNDYVAVAESLGNLRLPLIAPSIRDILRENPQAFLPNVEGALADLTERQIIIPAQTRGGFAWGERAKDLDAYRASCLWPEKHLMAVGS